MGEPDEVPAYPRAESIITAEINAIRAAIGTGALSVEYEGRKVTYRSLAEMTRSIAQLERELTDARGERQPPRRRFAEFHRGYRTSKADDPRYDP